MTCVLNGYFRSQPVSGQQRYATEIGNRLAAYVPGFRELAISPRAQGRRGLEWAELQWRAPLHTRGDVLVSLTSRSPLTVGRQVVAVHDVFVLTNPEWFSPSYARLHRRVIKHHLRHAKAIVAVSEPVAEQVRELARPGKPVVVAPNAPSELRGTRGTDPHSGFQRPGEYLLAVGNLEPRKNLATLLRAYGLLDAATRERCALVIVGAGAKAFRASEVGDGIPEGVRLTGRVSAVELAERYEHASAFGSTSWGEGFGIPVVEAASAGVRSMVLSDIPAYRWLATGPGIFFADPGSAEHVSAAMRAALDGNEAADLRRSISDRFSWDSSTRAVGDLVRTVSSSASDDDH